MGQRGPLPRPALKFPAANTGRRRVKRGIPPRPAEIDGRAGVEWDRVAALLNDAGLLAETDAGILSAYCLAVADMLAARALINEAGRCVSIPIQSSKGKRIGSRPIEHPAVKMLERASARVEKFAAALGLHPAARARLEADAPPEAPEGNRVLALRDEIRRIRSG